MNSEINKIVNRISPWLCGQGEDSDIVISSRVRLARNLHDYFFVDRASEDQLKKILLKVFDVSRKIKELRKAFFFHMSELDSLEQQICIERHLISSEFAESDNPRGFFINKNEDLGMMINEEDHIRIQHVLPGFNLDNAWIRIHQLDVALSQHLDYAYSDRYGHLTACLTNVGTGIRFSAFLHLPVLTFTKEIETVFSDMIPAGITVRGFHGEGSRVIGNFFQISNQYTLGWTEQGILDRVKPLIKRFVVLERKAREKVMNDQKIIIEDKIYRAMGVLSHARILSSIEFLSLLSALRLGTELNILTGLDPHVFNELMVITQPGHIQILEGKKLKEDERDEIRARLVRDKLGLN